MAGVVQGKRKEGRKEASMAEKEAGLEGYRKGEREFTEGAYSGLHHLPLRMG